jgi:hypothetical protein
MMLVNEMFGLGDVTVDTNLTATTTSSALKKRSRDSSIEEDISRTPISNKPRRPHRSSLRRQSLRSLDEMKSIPAISTPNNEQDKNYTDTRAHQANMESLTVEQQDFVRHWYEKLAQAESIPILYQETLSALATLTQTRPQLIFDYFKKAYPRISETTSPPKLLQHDALSKESQPAPPTLNTITATNDHLHPTILILIQKHLQTCRRRRPRTDGRRSVNSGPYRCTFGCGYATRRVFDWRRHEEIHEPQELWLCTLCSHTNPHNSDTKDVFLVGRKDKFLKHVREVHSEWKAEKVLEMSRVDWRREGEGEAWKCGTEGCKWEGREWDERCRHVLGHFDDKIVEERRRRLTVIRREKGGKGHADRGTASGGIVGDDEMIVEMSRDTVSPMDEA